ncbi:XdhC family protein [Allokutzneria sp. A3M-2-11 16]|uniref:XdhC family protein n=1 Tax=Allokutzneria sp. A3M-2-11 16 TaxID=2962043 RepID=UPI0020B76957|nr:XdhC/CoxI family protein [Allokutzneria sp. A3M-2-11 16]MCP3801545.1 XdhC family protein [Allokutzneria sp. A3M-2-11 16]
MHEIAGELARWGDADFAVATVIDVRGSAPRSPGAAMAVRSDGAVVGSVSGGCVEGAVYELAQQVLSEGGVLRHSFGYSADDPFAVGLTCGGEIEVFVRSGRSTAMAAAVTAARDAQAVALVTVLGTGAEVAVFADHHIGDSLPDVHGVAREMLLTGRTGLRTLPDGTEIFVESIAAPPRMLVFGAVDYAGAVSRIGRFLGYHVTICDARAVFATVERFPDADEVVVEWPHRYLASTHTDARTVVCVLTHDEKFDIPVLAEALRMPLTFVGALGSRRTNGARLERLRAAGVSEADLARLRAPIGLDLGARSPEETAVSIAAEIVAARHGGSGRPLSEVDGPIHRHG